MRALPLTNPGHPDARSPERFMLWLASTQKSSLAGGVLLGTAWMASQAVMPALLGHAIDEGISGHDRKALFAYAGAMLALSLVQAVAGIMRHRFAVTNWLAAAYTCVQVVVRQIVHVGGAISRKSTTGEVVAIGTSDLANMGHLMDTTARFSGSLISFVLVAAILLRTSKPLGLLVLIGVPVLMLAVGPLLKPLQKRSARSRELASELSTTASDIVGGLRVLRGVGGEDLFFQRYRIGSQRVRRATIRVATVQSINDALEVFLPGIFTIIVVWAGARSAVRGDISVGELVAFYGYTAFLALPLRTITEFSMRFVRARVSAQRICHVLNLQPDAAEPDSPSNPPAPGSDLHDLRTGLMARAGQLTALVSTDPDAATHLADRLGLHTAEPDDDVRLGTTPLTRLSRKALRERVVVSDTAALLLAGNLRSALDARGTATPQQLQDALDVASALDILDAAPEGLDTVVAERGRTFSGGQRQRLILARALLTDPEVLVLVEPTSAVDAHTEARIASRLRETRSGRTTLVATTSPLLLERVDSVAFLDGDRVVAHGTHAELLRDEPTYRAVVTRAAHENDEEDQEVSL